MKKILLGLGTIVLTIAPLTTIVACGSSKIRSSRKVEVSKVEEPKITNSEINNQDNLANTNDQDNPKNIKSNQDKSQYIQDGIETNTGDIKKEVIEEKDNKFKGEFKSLTNEYNFVNAKDIIWDNQFREEDKLTSITLPNIEQIGPFAFNSAHLTSLSLPKVKKIWQAAFEWSKLTTLELPEVEIIQDRAFSHSPLNSLLLPKVEEIGKDVFSNSLFSSLFLPKIKEIKNGSLKVKNLSSTNVTLPERFNTDEEKSRIFDGLVDKVNFAWVLDNGKIVSDQLIVNPILPNSDNTFEGDFSTWDKKTEFLNINSDVKNNQFENEKDLNSIDLPHAETIGDDAFAGDVNLHSVSLPKVKEIGEGAFKDSKLRTIDFPDVKTIGTNAFCNPKDTYSLPSITTISLPNAETIGDNAFSVENWSAARVTLPSKFNTPEEKARIFYKDYDSVTFIWV